MEHAGNDRRARLDQSGARRADHGSALPEIRPGREVGWIFMDGDALAIERQGDHTRERAARILHRHEE